MREKLNEAEAASSEVYKTLENKMADNTFLATAMKRTKGVFDGDKANKDKRVFIWGANEGHDDDSSVDNPAVVFEKPLDLARFEKVETTEIVRCADEDEDCVCKGEVYYGEANDLEDDKLSWKEMTSGTYK